MALQRFMNLIIAELSTENLKIQERLENTINSNKDVYEKVSETKQLLNELSLNELSIVKIQAIANSENNNQQNTPSNG
jgi:cell fate (sporulation/competence/biofilm development) regulator YmcA (YheA/YmcA/DUF963 family)